MKEYIGRQVEQRQRAWEAAKALLDKAAAEKRDLTAEEEQSYQRINADLNERAARIEALKADAEREAKIEAATREIAGQDFWSYGVEANRKTIEAFLHHHHAQGLSARKLAVEEVFDPSTYETYKI